MKNENEHEIFVHGEGMKEPKLIRLLKSALHDLEKILREVGVISGSEQRCFFREDDAQELDTNSIKNHDIIHCHRCKNVKVSVVYESGVKTHAFPPSATIKRIQKWAEKEFGLSPKDHVLRTGPDGKELPGDAHIGSFAHFPDCAVKLYLTLEVLVNG